MSQKTMKALYYSSVCISMRLPGQPLTLPNQYPQPRNFTIKEVPIPEVKDDEILLKGTVFSSSPRGSSTSVFMCLCVCSHLLRRLRSLYP